MKIIRTRINGGDDLKKENGLSLMEMLFAMFLLSLVIVSVAYCFSDVAPSISRSKNLTQAAFLSQAIMEIALLTEPFEPVDTPTSVEGAYFSRFFYTVKEKSWEKDNSFSQINVDVFFDGSSMTKPTVSLSALKKRSSIEYNGYKFSDKRSACKKRSISLSLKEYLKNNIYIAYGSYK